MTKAEFVHEGVRLGGNRNTLYRLAKGEVSTSLHNALIAARALGRPFDAVFYLPYLNPKE